MNGGDVSAADVEPLLLQSFTPYYNYRWRALRGVVWRDHKLVQGSTSELYALKDDPGEVVDLAEKRADLVTNLSGALEELVAEHAPLGWAVGRSVPMDELELLATLGYGTHYAGDAPFDPALPDPRERIGDIELVNEAGANFSRWGEVAMQYATAWQRDQHARQFLEKARALMLELRERNPRDPTIPYLLGAVERELRNYEAAIPLLEQAARDRPFDSVTRARLAETYAKMQRTNDAISEMQEALELVPEQPLYHQRLIVYSLDARRYADALQWMDRYVEAMQAGSAEQRDALDWVATQQKRIPPETRRTDVDSKTAQ
jgi:tetratricopeptide (TPR) repeat protein